MKFKVTLSAGRSFAGFRRQAAGGDDEWVAFPVTSVDDEGARMQISVYLSLSFPAAPAGGQRDQKGGEQSGMILVISKYTATGGGGLATWL